MKASRKLTEDQQQALLNILKEIISIFWGPDLKKCTAILQKSFLGSFDRLASQPGSGNFEALNEIKYVLGKFKTADTLFYHLEEGYRQTHSSLSLPLQNAEKNALIDALQQTQGNQTQAARILGVNRVTVWNRMKKYGIDVKKILST